MRATALLLAASMLTVLAAPTAVASTTTEGDYIAGTGDAVLFCEAQGVDIEAQLGACIGGQTFEIEGETVDAAIEDDNLADVGGFHQLVDADGNVVGDASGAFCGSVEDVSVPDGAVALEVYVDTGFGPLDCLENPPGTATTGTITATWT